MKYGGVLIAVSDMEKSKRFYKEVMLQKVEMDLGIHVSFESGISLQSNYKELVDAGLKPLVKENNFQLYFEVEDISTWFDKLKELKDIEFVHGIKEYPWGQRVMRIYDYDNHIIEIAESMDSVIKRYLKQGMSVDEVSEKTMFPIEAVRQMV